MYVRNHTQNCTFLGGVPQPKGMITEPLPAVSKTFSNYRSKAQIRLFVAYAHHSGALLNNNIWIPNPVLVLWDILFLMKYILFSVA